MKTSVAKNTETLPHHRQSERFKHKTLKSPCVASAAGIKTKAGNTLTETHWQLLVGATAPTNNCQTRLHKAQRQEDEDEEEMQQDEGGEGRTTK